MGRRAFLKTGSALAAAGALPRIAAAQQADKIIFGGSVPMTGTAAETGLNVLRGYECAVKYVNEKMGGVDIGGRKYALELSLFGWGALQVLRRFRKSHEELRRGELDRHE